MIYWLTQICFYLPVMSDIDYRDVHLARVSRTSR